MKLIKNAALFVAATLLSVSVMAQTEKDVCGVISGSDAHTKLAAAIKTADLETTLKGAGPFTVFAPTNKAFTKLTTGVVNDLFMPQSKAELTGILTYHVVAGNLDAKAVKEAIKKGGGKAVLTTVAGGMITASIEKGKVIITDGKGGKSTVTATDLRATNGIVHVVSDVLMPKE